MSKYGYCKDCKQWDLLGYMACQKKNLCPNCAAKIFNADPNSVRAELVHHQVIDEINVGYACRALLGGGKGKFVMEELKKINPTYYERIMSEAVNRLEKEVEDGNLSDV